MKEARTFFDRLLEENLVFKNSKDAANFLNNYNNSGFQNGGILKKTQQARKVFVNYYVSKHENGLECLLDCLKNSE